MYSINVNEKQLKAIQRTLQAQRTFLTKAVGDLVPGLSVEKLHAEISEIVSAVDTAKRQVDEIPSSKEKPPVVK